MKRPSLYLHRDAEYPARSKPETAAWMATQESLISTRYARTSRGIKQLFCPLDIADNVGILDGSGHDKIDISLQQFAKLIEKPEIGIDASMGIHGFKLDQKVNFSRPGSRPASCD